MVNLNSLFSGQLVFLLSSLLFFFFFCKENSINSCSQFQAARELNSFEVCLYWKYCGKFNGYGKSEKKNHEHVEKWSKKG